MSKENIISEELHLEVNKVLHNIDPLTITKRGIREARRVLQKLAMAKYPKKTVIAKKEIV